MRAIALLTLLALVAANCVAPNQYSPSLYGKVKVFAPHDDWASSYRAEWAEYLPTLDPWGPDFALTDDETEATVVVRHTEATPECRELGLGADDAIHLDPVCLQGQLALNAALAHEIGHALGLEHVCRKPGESDDCSPVGYGVAIMNPSLYERGDVEPSTTEATSYPVPQTEPTDLDLAEMRRARGRP